MGIVLKYCRREEIGGIVYRIYTTSIGYIKFAPKKDGNSWYTESNLPSYIVTRFIEKYNELVLDEKNTEEIEVENTKKKEEE